MQLTQHFYSMGLVDRHALNYSSPLAERLRQSSLDKEKQSYSSPLAERLRQSSLDNEKQKPSASTDEPKEAQARRLEL